MTHSKNLKIGLILLITLLISGIGYGQGSLPEVSLKDMTGNEVNLADFGKDGKITVISFWATWCSPCKKELNNIVDLYPEWRENYNVEVVAISVDDARNSAKVKSYANGQSWEFTVLLDANAATMRALNFPTVPYTVLVDAAGNIIYRHQGYVDGDEYELEDKIKALAQK